jgi:ABC-type multidrug transport system permease subunit
MSTTLILLIAASILSWLVFTWLLKIVKTTLSTAITAAAIVLILQLFFGIGPEKVLQTILNLPQSIQGLFGS